MINMSEGMTPEEVHLIDKLKMEMLNAVSLQDLQFYKKEITRIKEQAAKRHRFLHKLTKRAEKL
ncbi:hypothetical protein [Metabacillus iocasae]|uniref:Ribosomal protein L29 n=1 Tax=Priestia iocasae TaxID=2291674 RepID=A0ABS2QQ82_9BACI|nr:hypothetical protein [Metabacillus iocasae]MBM7701625.1 hypothetical protein [Metabacillus iocasae]